MKHLTELSVGSFCSVYGSPAYVVTKSKAIALSVYKKNTYLRTFKVYQTYSNYR